MIKIGIIMGSTRPGRKAEVVARWACEIARKREDAEFELVDQDDRVERRSKVSEIQVITNENLNKNT